eukprot:UC4_evm1s1290
MAKGKGKARRARAEKAQRILAATEPSSNNSNPFELRQNRRKHEVLNRRISGERGNSARARDRSVKIRNETLLKDYKDRGRASSFRDRRIGEYDATMTPEEKMMQRWAIEQKKRHERAGNRGLFNLDDDEDFGDEVMGLTHLGQSLGSISAQKSKSFGGGDDDNEDDLMMDADTVSDLHFGGFELKRRDHEIDSDAVNNNAGDDQSRTLGKKSKQEVMKEIIGKSRAYRAERQSERDDQAERIEQVDEQFRDIKSFLEPRSDKDEVPVSKVDDYDTAVFDLRTDLKARATDRMKTPQEIAMLEFERLRRLEKERKMRMNDPDAPPTSNPESSADFEAPVLDDGDQDPQSGVLSYDNQGNSPRISGLGNANVSLKDIVRKALGRSPAQDGSINQSDSGEEEDDISDGDSDDYSEGADSEDDSEDTESGDDSENTESGDNGAVQSHGFSVQEDRSDDVKFSDDVVQRGKHSKTEKRKDSSEHGKITKPSGKRARKVSEESEETNIPFTFDIPQSLAEFNTTLNKYKCVDRATVVSRMQTCNTVQLHVDNRKKIENLFSLILQRIDLLCSDCSNATKDSPEDILKEIDSFAKPLFLVTKQVPCHAASYFVNRLKEISRKFKSSKSRKNFPLFKDLVILKLSSLLFPVTDFRHCVTGLGIVLLGQTLSVSRIKCKTDLLLGIFVATLCLEYTRDSKRYMPELVPFLNNIISLALEDPDNVAMDYSPAFQLVWNSTKLRKEIFIIKGESKHIFKPLSRLDLIVTDGSRKLISSSEDIFSAALCLLPARNAFRDCN